MSIQNTLLLSIIGLMVITVSTITLSTYQATEKVLIDHALDRMDGVSAEVIDRSTQFLQPAETTTLLTQQLADHQVIDPNNTPAIERYLFEQLMRQPSFAGIYFANKEGDFIYVNRDNHYREHGFRSKLIYRENEQRRVELLWRDDQFKEIKRQFDTQDNYDPRVRPWFIKALEYRGLVWTEPYIFYTSKKPGITISTPVVLQDGSQEITGVFGVDIEITEISNFLSQLNIGKQGSAFIIDSRGQVLAHPVMSKIKRQQGDTPGFNLITEINDPVARAAFRSLQLPLSRDYSLQQKRFTQFTYQDTVYRAVFTPFTQFQWPLIMAIYVPEEDFLGVFHHNQQRNILFATIITLIAALLGFFLARSLIRPISQLEQQAQLIKQGKWDQQDHQPIETGYAEIRQTVEAITSMVKQLHGQQNQIELLNQSLKKNSIATTFRLAQAAEYKNPMPSQSLTRMATLSKLLAETLEQPETFCEQIFYAAAMHDIGNIGLPDKILKKPSGLDLPEWEIVKTHPLIGADILKNPETEMLKMAHNIVLTHHEKWNGFGYPKGIAAMDIPLEGRICAVADAFDSMASERVYRPAFELDRVFSEIRNARGSHFDPDIVDALLKIEPKVRYLYSDVPGIEHL